jgi:Tol biopolymer transport system component
MVERHKGNGRRQSSRATLRWSGGAIGARGLAATILVAAVALAGASAAFAHPQRSSRASAASQWLLFTARPPALGVEQIYRVQASGKGLKRLTKGAYPAEGPAFSPDGKRIAFSRVGSGIYSMNLDGSGVRALTKNGRDSYPAWSPDGKQLAFLRPLTNGWSVFVMSASGAGARKLPDAPAAGRPSWTGNGLVIPTNGDLVKIDPRSGRVQKDFGALIDASIGVDTTAVSPDLSTISFVGARPPDPGDTGCGEGVPCQRFALFTQTLHPRKTPRSFVLNGGPASFSADGKRLAFVLQNRLTLQTVAGKGTSAIKTGKLSLTTSTPPAWQPR